MASVSTTAFSATSRTSADRRDLRAAAEVLGDRIQLLTEAVDELAALLPEPGLRGEAREALEEPRAAGVLEAARAAWSEIEGWDRDAVRAALDRAKSGVDAGGRSFYHPLRAALTGKLEGPELPDVAYLLGRRRTLQRLERGLATAGDREAGARARPHSAPRETREARPRIPASRSVPPAASPCWRSTTPGASTGRR